MRLITSALTYFGFVFAAGFILGPVRILVLVPRIGTRMGELLELPLLLVTSLFAARWINRCVGVRAGGAALGVGAIALGLMLCAELLVGTVLRGVSPWAVLFDRDPVSGTAYYASLLICGAMPWLLTRLEGRSRTE